jgi:hypothetical protein
MRSWRNLRETKFGNWLTLLLGVSRLGQNGCGKIKREERRGGEKQVEVGGARL